MHEVGKPLGCCAPVVEFFGLPGAGKSTVAAALVAALKGQGIAVHTTDDFVTWLARQSRFRKLAILVSNGPWAGRQLWSALRFGLSLRPAAGFSLPRIVLMPFINCCFDRYLSLNRDAVVIMDQANTQLVWSVGAYAASYDAQLLRDLSRAARGRGPTTFAFVSASVRVSAERIRQRASSGSRFDKEPSAGIQDALYASANLMTELASGLASDGQRVIELDATAPVDVNARRLLVLVRDGLLTGAAVAH